MHSDEMIIRNGVQAMDTIEIVKSDGLIHLIFDAITKYVETIGQHLLSYNFNKRFIFVMILSF